MVTSVMQYQGGRLVPQVMELASIQWANQEDYLVALEEERRANVRKCREYFDGKQNDDHNRRCLEEYVSKVDASADEKSTARALALWYSSLPEHIREHEYSTQIKEVVNFIAARLASKARIELADAQANTVVSECLDSSPELAGSPDDDEIVLVNVIREAIKVGDVAALVRWHQDDAGTCRVEFWESDTVDLRFAEDGDTVIEAIVDQIDWRVPPGSTTGEPEPMVIRRRWKVVERPTIITTGAAGLLESELPVDLLPLGDAPVGELGMRMECAEQEYWLKSDGEHPLGAPKWWGVPFLPWWPVRGGKTELRGVRGEPLISEQTMKTADRYNANEQLSWIIGRYNSHSNIAVSGDAATIQAGHKKIQKDVANILTFPGATVFEVLSLPTDPQMIEHQKNTLTESLYNSMGVTRIDQSSLENSGAVSGYALEILDQKSAGTFAAIATQIKRDLKRLINLVLDCHAYWSAAQAVVGGEAAASPAGYLRVDPASAFSNRKMEIRLGSGHVVDVARIRDNVTAKLISKKQGLREMGYGDEEIKLILEELQDEAEQAAAAQREAFGERGTEGGGAGRFAGGSSTQAGTRFSTTNRPESDSQTNTTRAAS